MRISGYKIQDGDSVAEHMTKVKNLAKHIRDTGERCRNNVQDFRDKATQVEDGSKGMVIPRRPKENFTKSDCQTYRCELPDSVAFENVREEESGKSEAEQECSMLQMPRKRALCSVTGPGRRGPRESKWREGRIPRESGEILLL